MVVNNLIYDPGARAVHYNLIAEEWIEHPYELGRLALIGGVDQYNTLTRGSADDIRRAVRRLFAAGEGADSASRRR